MTKLATLFLTATRSLASSAALAADSGAQSNNGHADDAADAGQGAPDARENVAPKNVDKNGVNTGSGGPMLHPDGSSMNNDGMPQ
ncbi:protein YbgS, partial [Escherichia coli]|nr:protein YbgS [Escherichia coli]